MAPEAAKRPHTTTPPPPRSPVGWVVPNSSCPAFQNSPLAFQMLFEFRASSDPEAHHDEEPPKSPEQQQS